MLHLLSFNDVCRFRLYNVFKNQRLKFSHVCFVRVSVCEWQYRMSLRDPPFEPPSISELQELLLKDRKPTGHVNQVWPNIYIGNEYVHRLSLTHTHTHTQSNIYDPCHTEVNMWLFFRVAARDKGILHSLGITHIVNAAHGPHSLYSLYVNTGPRFYRDMAVDYYGVGADDAIDFILSPFFYPTARYIRAALAMGGKSVPLRPNVTYTVCVCVWTAPWNKVWPF